VDTELGDWQVDTAAASLKRFSAQIDQQRSGSPAFLALIPVGALGP
jgi:hypothetical protein